MRAIPLLRTESRRHARVGWLLDRPIAHRGLHDARRPENSGAAFEAAAAAGFPIELDVRALADDAVAVFHDRKLERMTGAPGRLEACRLDDLATLRLAGSDEPIPTLDEVLERVAGRVPVVVELKNDHHPGALERGVRACIARHGAAFDGRLAVQSFNPFTVAWFRLHAPEITRGLLASDFADATISPPRRFVLRRLLLAPMCAPDYVGYDLHALPYWAPALLHRLGIPLLGWTVRTAADLERARGLVDNVIFEGVRP